MMLLVLPCAGLGFAGRNIRTLHGMRASAISALALTDLKIGDQVKVIGDDAYPRFYNVPMIKPKGFAAHGSVGTVVKLYLPGPGPDGSDHLDRSDERDVQVEFLEPKPWKAHLAAAELELLGDVSHDFVSPENIVMASEIELCEVGVPELYGSRCDRVADFMTPLCDALVLSPEIEMLDAARQLKENGVTGAPVVKDGRLVGILTQFDFLYREGLQDSNGLGSMVALDSGQWENVVKKSMAKTVSNAMSKPIAIVADSDMRQVAQLMLRRRFNHMPVVDGDEGMLVGILTSQNVLNHVIRGMEQSSF